ncbi:TPA: hypothetical protein EYP13_04765, partial [Candidatus Micrarchaeota archaeon]|nr:hypothetical protein [Candidatus Micrarchaeota archaeon]
MEINWLWLETGYTIDNRVLTYPLIYRYVGDIKELQVFPYLERSGRVAVKATAIKDHGSRTVTGHLTSWESILRRLTDSKEEFQAAVSEIPATMVFDDLVSRIEEKYPFPRLFLFNHATFSISIDHFAAAEYLASRHYVAVVSDSGRVDTILRWNPQTGIWERNGAAYIVQELSRIIPDEAMRILLNSTVVNNVKMALAGYRSISVEEFARSFNDYSRYIPVANGILDMERRELLPFSPDFRFTFKLAVRFDRKAKANRIRRFIHEIAGSKEDEENILRMIGYILVPKQPLQSFFILYGTGSNGKSTLIKVLRTFLGEDLVATRTLSDLLHNRFAFAELDGKLLNAATETPRGGH